MAVTNLKSLTGTSKLAGANAPAWRAAQALTVIIAALAAVAAAGGLFLPGLYRDNAWVVPQNQGWDLFTLIILPVLLATLLAVRQGSARALMVWTGLVSFLWYTYTGASVAYSFNAFFLIYVSLFGLTIAALVATGVGIDVARLKERFDVRTPRVAVAAYLVLLAIILTLLWLSQIIPFLTTGTLPQSIVDAGGTTSYIFALDLGVIVPLSLLAAVWLWRGKPWGYFLAGTLLIKDTTMGLVLLTITWTAGRAGIPTAPELLGSYALIAGGGIAMSLWFLRHCREKGERA